MKHYHIALVLALILMLTSVSAYQGFNRYYYTDNYHPTVHYPTPPATAYTSSYTYYGAYPGYNTYYGSSATYPTYVTTYSYPYYPATYYPATYYQPYTTAYVYPTQPTGAYRSFGVYGDDGGWGFYYSSGSICSIYGYC